jgi:hypothetical protein
MSRSCQQLGCLRAPRSGYANCDDCTEQLLLQAFKSTRVDEEYLAKTYQNPPGKTHPFLLKREYNKRVTSLEGADA